MDEFKSPDLEVRLPTLLQDESELLKRVDDIDLLVIASPNYLHTEQLLRWARHDITILVEKPVAVSQEQHDVLSEFSQSPECRARIWVAMEYRYIPAISKLLSLLPTIGDVKMVTIRENRYPFLHKIGGWNRDRTKTGKSVSVRSRAEKVGIGRCEVCRNLHSVSHLTDLYYYFVFQVTRWWKSAATFSICSA